MPSAGGNLVSQAHRHAEGTLAGTAAGLAVEVVAHQETVDIEVHVKTATYAETVQHTQVQCHLVSLRRFVDTTVAHTHIRTDVPYTALAVTTEEVPEVEQDIGMDIAEAELLLVEPVSVAALTGHLHPLVVDAHLCGTLGLQTAVHQLHANARRDPFAHRQVKGRGDAVAEATLLVVITKVD